MEKVIDTFPPDGAKPGLDASVRDYILGQAFPRPARPEGSRWFEAPEPIDDGLITARHAADVVIIGAGHAGVCAALSAAEAGARVAVIERQPEQLHRYLGMGHVGHINSALQKKYGVPEIDLQEFITGWQLRSNNRSNAGLIMRFAKNSGACLDWLLGLLPQEDYDSITVQYPESPVSPSVASAGIKTWVGCANVGPVLMTKALNAARERAHGLGAEFFYGYSAEQLILKDGAVTGVIALGLDGSYHRFDAAGGVLLSAGDFSGNPEMCHDLATEIVDNMGQDYMPSGAGCDGSGICLGVWAGGKLEPRPLSTMGGSYYYPTDSLGDPLGNSGLLWLNKYGRRYCNEAFGDYVLAGIPGMRQPRGRVTMVFDSNILETGLCFPLGHMALDYSDPMVIRQVSGFMEAAVEAGDEGVRVGSVTVYAGDTPEQLALRLGYEGESAENFAASVRRYNELCHRGVDEDYGKEPQFLLPLDHAPYFGYSGEIKPGPILATTGGLLTDELQNVLDHNCEPIPGLYASGNCCGGRFGLQYSTPVAGISIGMAQTMGMLAGRDMAARAIKLKKNGGII